MSLPVLEWRSLMIIYSNLIDGVEGLGYCRGSVASVKMVIIYVTVASEDLLYRIE